MNVNSPEYRALVTSLLGKRVEFEEVLPPISKKKQSKSRKVLLMNTLKKQLLTSIIL